ncbi:MAG: hypothetical protein U5R14_07500 [Gemmatimonadota bacterium]|nr:hypothetical protein [Gemmatimonadota bacterium]
MTAVTRWKRLLAPGRYPTVRETVLVLVALAAAAIPTVSEAQVRSGGDGLIYVATYERSIHVLRESDLTLVDKIATTSGIPGTLTPTADGRRIIAQMIDYEHVEVIDLETRESVDAFTLSERNSRIRIRGMAVHPNGRHAVLMTRRYEKLRDRWEIGEMELVLYDMDEHRVVQDVPWPDGEPQEGASFAYSPDGEALYFFMDDVRIYDTDTYEPTDRWEYGDALDQGLGDFEFGFPTTPREVEGWHTGMFRIDEEVQDRELLGVARANPGSRDIDFFLLGPSETGPTSRVSFALAPDRDHAYGLHQELENYQMWAIDMEAGTARHVEFDGRPRMELEVSSNGELLYLYNAGNTIDVFDADSLEHIRTVELDADTLGRLWVLPSR